MNPVLLAKYSPGHYGRHNWVDYMLSASATVSFIPHFFVQRRGDGLENQLVPGRPTKERRLNAGSSTLHPASLPSVKQAHMSRLLHVLRPAIVFVRRPCYCIPDTYNVEFSAMDAFIISPAELFHAYRETIKTVPSNIVKRKTVDDTLANESCLICSEDLLPDTEVVTLRCSCRY
ncbi:hypothetical protein BDV06DRAFT_130032 [Aspergillus oleicola]